MSVLDIHVLGSPVLREETVPVAEVTDELRALIRDMFETMYAANGIGLAAPQVGRRERVAVIDVDDKPFAIVNPVIVSTEGTVRGGLDEQGRPLEVEGTELLARCLQHEIDHLHGRLFIDYFSTLKKRSAKAKWERERVKYPTGIRKLDPAEIAARRDDEAL
jgi:peptide deformylase